MVACLYISFNYSFKLFSLICIILNELNLDSTDLAFNFKFSGHKHIMH